MTTDKETIIKRLKKEGPKKFRYNFEVLKGSGIFTNGRMQINYNQLFKKLGFDPVNFNDKRVLEIGAYDGALAFYLEDMGAKVTAIDVQEPTSYGFSLVHELRNSTVVHKLMSVYDLSKEFMGTFDYITFFGVFYHLKHPILALERINDVSHKGTLLFCGGQLCDGYFYNSEMNSGCNIQYFTKKNFPAAFSGELSGVNDLPYCAFVETSFLKDTSNWFIPNRRCVEAWLKRTGFKLIRYSIGVSKISENPGHRLSSEEGLVVPTNEIMTRVSGHFCASYVEPPELEFKFLTYKAPNYIPTRIKLEEKDKRIKELEREIEHLKKSG